MSSAPYRKLDMFENDSDHSHGGHTRQFRVKHSRRHYIGPCTGQGTVTYIRTGVDVTFWNNIGKIFNQCMFAT
jgi:hypothetical protein